MSEEEFERNETYRESFRTEPGRNGLAGADPRVAPGSDLGQRAQNLRERPIGRPLGSPLPAGSAGKALQSEAQPFRTAPPPGRALSAPLHQPEGEHSSAMQWAAGAIKQAMPFVQRLLPLIDGNIAAAVANLLSPHPHQLQPAPKVDLTPVENGLAELHMQQSDLRDQLIEQNSSIKRVEDQLESVREATDRNTLEQQELIEDLKAIGNKVNIFALLLMGLLVISVLLNLVLFLHIQRVLP
jgi:hypothetical protein